MENSVKKFFLPLPFPLLVMKVCCNLFVMLEKASGGVTYMTRFLVIAIFFLFRSFSSLNKHESAVDWFLLLHPPANIFHKTTKDEEKEWRNRSKSRYYLNDNACYFSTYFSHQSHFSCVGIFSRKFLYSTKGKKKLFSPFHSPSNP